MITEVIKEIKIITWQLNYAANFELEVNNALEDGWIIEKIETLIPHTEDKFTMLYALLVKKWYIEVARKRINDFKGD